jgi:hypothetical protein
LLTEHAARKERAMPGRDPHDHWDDEEDSRRRSDRYERETGPRHEPYYGERSFSPGPSRWRGGEPPHGPSHRPERLRDAFPDPARRPDYSSQRYPTPEEREAVGGPYTDYGRAFGGYGAGGGYTPTPEEGVGRGGRGWDERSAPGAWFGRAPADSWRDDRARHAEGPHRGRGPKGYSRSAERIREDVSDRLTDDPHLDASDIEVAVDGTEVTLTGFVDSRGAKRRAEDCADDVTGVTHVQNNLRVRPRPGTVAAQSDPRLVAIAEGRDPAKAGREAAEAHREAGGAGDERSGPPPR